MSKPIPLLDLHKEIGATVGEFAGFLMPILYKSIREEHLSVRNNAGIFDISHMAMIHVTGEDTDRLVDTVSARKTLNHPPNNMLGPTLMLNEKGGIKDDIMLYKIGENNWLIVGNAINTEKDIKWLQEVSERHGFKTEIVYANEKYTLLAIQGPKAKEFMAQFNNEALSLKPLEFMTDKKIAGIDTWIISRSGWTGEDGFEIIAKHEDAKEIFKLFIDKGVQPCGLGARDSLRLEMGFVLYGNDIDENTNPVEARYWMGFDRDKENCIGCDALKQHLRKGVEKTRIALKLSKKDKMIPRTGMKIYIEDNEIGMVTSGGYSPILNRPIAMAYLKTTHALMGLNVYIDIRGKMHKAKITDFPLI